MRMNILCGNLVVVVALVVLTACTQIKIEGSWVEPIPGMPNMQQGFTLYAGGKASSVNMATLQYESWEQQGDLLILTGKSIGNHQTIDFTDTLMIEKLTQDSLILKIGDFTQSYFRSKAVSETTPAAVVTPAKEVVTVKGDLIIGHEVRSFVPVGDTLAYWVVDKTGNLAQKYDSITQGLKNGTPVYAELDVIDMGKSDEGFAQDYDGVYNVLKIKKIAVK